MIATRNNLKVALLLTHCDTYVCMVVLVTCVVGLFIYLFIFD